MQAVQLLTGLHDRTTENLSVGRSRRHAHVGDVHDALRYQGAAGEPEDLRTLISKSGQAHEQLNPLVKTQLDSGKGLEVPREACGGGVVVEY